MSTKKYTVKHTNRPISLSGQGADSQWNKAKELTDFIYPWRTETAPKTIFKALYNDTHFYFLYRAIDPEIITKKAALAEKAAVQSDRIELFFKGKTDADPYYSLELDALGRILDTKANFGNKVDFDWTWPTGELIIKAATDAEGYWVEGSISLKSMRALGIYHEDGILRTGLYRAEYVTETDGQARPQWISWVHPNTPTPNFHTPTSFGILKLAKRR